MPPTRPSLADVPSGTTSPTSSRQWSFQSLLLDSIWVGGQRGCRGRTSYAPVGRLPPVQRAGSRSTDASSHPCSASPGGGVGGDSDSETVGRRSTECQHSLITHALGPPGDDWQPNQICPDSWIANPWPRGKLGPCRAQHGIKIPLGALARRTS